VSKPRPFEGPLRSIGVVYREHTPEVLAILDRVRGWAETHDVSVTVEPNAGRGPGPGLDLMAEPVDLVVALGGDGTFLRASRLVVATEIPVLGVNLGRLGFLTAIPDSDLEVGLARVRDGEALLERRFRLRGRIARAGLRVADPPYAAPGGRPEDRERTASHSDRDFFALNDMVVHTSGAARVTPLTLSIGETDDLEEVGSFAADGVIVSTPTGSTAYSMSAGGPIIVPDVEALVVTPICPHSLAVRPLVVPAHETVCVGSLDPDADHQLTVDGQVVHQMAPGEQVVIARDPLPVWLVRMPGQTFFRTMRRKLNWAARPPERT
jgi:NAD+ kinase